MARRRNPAQRVRVQEGATRNAEMTVGKHGGFSSGNFWTTSPEAAAELYQKLEV